MSGWDDQGYPIEEPELTYAELITTTADERGHFVMGSVFAGGELWPQSIREQAQDLVYEAWDVAPKQRVALARKALTLDPGCVDAFNVLACEPGATPAERLALCRFAVEEARRRWGDEIERNKGHLWSTIELRPYMRALSSVCQAQWAIGLRDQAIADAEQMLELNEGDNQGMRYVLALWYVATRRWQDLTALDKAHGDGMLCHWPYTLALGAFASGASATAARRKLNQALSANPHVPTYLLGIKRLPTTVTASFALGSKEEAVDYATAAMSVWDDVPGAAEWLAEHWAPFRPKESGRG
jgi:tetratricopeptide (TPR) repeat protein